MRFANALLLAAASMHAAVLFEPNRGQVPNRIEYVAHTADGIAGVTASGLEMERPDGSRSSIHLAGANKGARGVPERRAVGVSHYAIGADSSRWIWDVPRYAEVRYLSVYPGIDVDWHARQDDLEFDFLVSPGADASRIALQFPAAVRLTALGELVSGPTRLRRPEAWQTVDGVRRPVEIGFAVAGDSMARLRLGRYDRTRPLVIDPTVLMASFLGGSNNEANQKVAVGADGAIYLAGTTMSADFPASLLPGSLLNHPEILLAPDVYVMRLEPDGSAQDWSIFLGGNGAEAMLGLRRDALGDIYVLGTTASPNFPVTAGSYQNKISPYLRDLFVVKLDAQTGHIKASTFLGANSPSAALAVDSAGGVYVGGKVNDDSFKTTAGVYQPNPGGNQGVYGTHTFVLRLNSALTALVYSTLFDAVTVATVEVDDNGNAVLGGGVQSYPPPGAPAFQPVNPIPGVNQQATSGAVVAKLNPTGTAMLFATQLHGDGASMVSDVKIGQDGNIHVLGYASLSNFPQVNPLTTDARPANYSYSGDPTPFWTKLPPAGGSPVQSTVLYGPEFNTAPSLAYPQTLRLAFQSGGQPCLLNVGTSVLAQSTGALVAASSTPSFTTYGGSLVCVNASGDGLGLKTLLPPGASYSEAAGAPDGALVFTGAAQSTFATTPGAPQPLFGGGVNGDQLTPYPLSYGDSFFMRLSFNNPAPAIRSLIPESLLLVTGLSTPFSFDLFGSGFAYGATVTLNGQPVTSSFINGGDISVTGIDYGSVQSGANQIVVSLPGPGGGSSQATLMGINPTPPAPSVSPASVTQGSGDTKIVIRTANLGKNSTLYWNGQPRAAQYVTDTPATSGHFELILSSAELATPFSATVAIGNPAPGGGISPNSYFAVAPASGDGPLTLSAASNPALFGGAVPLGPTVGMNGSGFTSSTRAWWDGAEVTVTLLSNVRINITPPAADLSHWGAHDVYVSNTAYRSATVRQFVARSVTGAAYAASDPVKQRLYVLLTPSVYQAPDDLAIFDLASGNLVSTITGLVQSPQGLALSSDGRYLYIGSTTGSKVTRFDTVAGAVDLQWTVETSNNYPAVMVFTVPGSPDSVVVWTLSQGVVIYDHGQPRPGTAVGAGFAAGDQPLFVTSSRMYLQPPNGYCWRWMEYDGSGIYGGALSCAADPGADLIHVDGWVYLSDGSHTYMVLTPGTSVLNTFPQPSFLVDLPNRRILQAAIVTQLQITEFNLDSEQQITQGVFGTSSQYAPTLLNGAGGTAVLVTGNWLAVIP